MPILFVQVSKVGPPGSAGPAGTTNPRGVWASGNTYAQNDMVTYSSAAYLALQASGPGGAAKQPDTNPTYWQAMEGVPGVTGATGAGYGGTSSTSLTPASGNKSFTTQAGMAWAVGAPIQATSASTPASYMSGTVYSYASTTLVIAVTAYAGATKADWVFSAPTGLQGPAGTTGAPGAIGPAATPVPPYMSGLIAGPDTSKTILGTTHGIATAALIVAVYDNSTPKRHGIDCGPPDVDPVTFDVTITFAVAQSDYYVVINGGGSPGTSGGAPSGTGMVAVTSGVPRLAVANTDYMPAVGGNGLLMVGKVTTGVVSLATATVDYQPPLGFTPENITSKGAANGYCPLDGSSQVPLVNLPVANLSGGYVASMFNWYGVSPGGTLSIGSNPITLPGMTPIGVNGNDTLHTLLITDVTTPANTEVVTITGGAARSGMTGSQTLTITCAKAHTGSWTIGSASMGIEECIVVATGAAWNIYGPLLVSPGVNIHLSGSFYIYGTIYVPYGCTFSGDESTLLYIQSTLTNVPVFDCAATCTFSGVNLSASGMVSGSAAIRIGNLGLVAGTLIDNCGFTGFYDGIVNVNGQLTTVRNCTFENITYRAIVGNNTSNLDTDVLIAHSNQYGNFVGAFACIHITSGGAVISDERMIMSAEDQVEHGIYGRWTANASGLQISNCRIGYCHTSGIDLSTSALFQYVTITGNTVDQENGTGATKGIVCNVSGAGIMSQVCIAGNVLEGNPSTGTFTAIDITGCSAGTVTAGPNNITNATTIIAGAAALWTAMTLQGSGSTLWTATSGCFTPAFRMDGDGMIRLCGSATVASFTNISNFARLPYSPPYTLNGTVSLYDTTSSIWVQALWIINTSGMLEIYAPTFTPTHGAKVWLDGIVTRLT